MYRVKHDEYSHPAYQSHTLAVSKGKRDDVLELMIEPRNGIDSVVKCIYIYIYLLRINLSLKYALYKVYLLLTIRLGRIISSTKDIIPNRKKKHQTVRIHFHIHMTYIVY